MFAEIAETKEADAKNLLTDKVNTFDAAKKAIAAKNHVVLAKIIKDLPDDREEYFTLLYELILLTDDVATLQNTLEKYKNLDWTQDLLNDAFDKEKPRLLLWAHQQNKSRPLFENIITMIELKRDKFIIDFFRIVLPINMYTPAELIKFLNTYLSGRDQVSEYLIEFIFLHLPDQSIASWLEKADPKLDGIIKFLLMMPTIRKKSKLFNQLIDIVLAFDEFHRRKILSALFGDLYSLGSLRAGDRIIHNGGGDVCVLHQEGFFGLTVKSEKSGDKVQFRSSSQWNFVLENRADIFNIYIKNGFAPEPCSYSRLEKFRLAFKYINSPPEFTIIPKPKYRTAPYSLLNGVAFTKNNPFYTAVQCNDRRWFNALCDKWPALLAKDKIHPFRFELYQLIKKSNHWRAHAIRKSLDDPSFHSKTATNANNKSAFQFSNKKALNESRLETDGDNIKDDCFTEPTP